MDDYETLNKIGDGTFGTVYLCRKKKQLNEQSSSSSSSSLSVATTTHSGNYYDVTNNNCNQFEELVAIKKMKKRYYNWDECMKLREIRALKKLNHVNIILLKEVVRENDNLYLIFEHMEENLYQLIKNQLIPFQEIVIKEIILQILQGLAYIHRNGFFHRDIKPENLLCRNGSKLIKIADFGLTREINSLPPFTDYVSTRWYRAPELLLHSKNYNYQVDMWALGCIIGELYTLQPMFPGRTEIDQIFKICQLIGPPNDLNWSEGQRLASLIQFNFPNLIPLKLEDLFKNYSCSQDGIKLVELLLKWNSNDRPSAKELLDHNYFKN